MCFELLYVIFVVAAVLNYILQDIKIDKIKKESLDKDKVIDSLMAHNKALRKLNDGFKDHERRINDIEERLSLSREPEKPEEPKYTCKDCKYYNPYNGIGFADAVNYFKCEEAGCTFSIECVKPCREFEKKEGLDEDEDENVFYVNNVKIDMASKNPYDEVVGRITKLYLGGGIGYYDANILLERLKQ